jgi:hypothetical protein
MPMHKLSSLTNDDLTEAAAKATNAQRDGPLPPFSDGPLPPFSDEALALRFAERYAGDLRFVASWGKWLTWDGMRWRIDNTVRASTTRAPSAVRPPPTAINGSSPSLLRAERLSPPSSVSRALTVALPPPSINGTRTHGR